MSKRNILELMSLSIAAIFSIIFVLFKTNNASVIISFLYFIPSAISIYMFYNFNKIKNCKNKILKIVIPGIFYLSIAISVVYLISIISHKNYIKGAIFYGQTGTEDL